LGLGRQQEKIPGESIKVSSVSDSNVEYARLRYHKKCWCAIEKPKQTISVDLGQLVSISGVATQSCKYGKVTEYKIRYSYDGRTWYGFPSNTSLMVRIFMLLYLLFSCAILIIVSTDNHSQHIIN
jgi:hypothetical protein